ncbi:MAG: T9SS type A sorting domain-containing protein [Muribaculaceae bacterium]
MKKVLLLSLGLAATLAANAYTEPTEYPDYSWQGVAPNGSLAVSEFYGAMTIVDLTTGVEYYYEDPDYIVTYSGGIGNYVSNTGIVVGSIANASYWQNGEWHELSGPETVDGHMANGITPDGSRICGGVMMEAMSTEAEGIMLLPCYWDATADGYGEYHILPHPSLDFSGRVPQYITAIAISDDGKTIVGQVRDYTGFVHQPIVYTEGADGEWSYKLLAEEVFHPEGVELPEWPGESPYRPQYTDYMTEEEAAAYQEALNNYWYGGGDKPEASDYMTAEAYEAYLAAEATYQALYEEWAPLYDAYQDAFYELFALLPSYEFNSVFVTPDGKKYVTSGSVEMEVEDSWWPVSVYYPAIGDIATGEMTHVDNNGVSMSVCDVPNNDVIFLCNGIWDLVPLGWIYKDGVITPVEDWLATESEEMADWIENNLWHEIITGYEFDEETGEYIVDENGNPIPTTIDALCTGICIANRDLSTVAMWANDGWSGYYYTAAYIFSLENLGVKDVVTVGNNTITFDQEGNMVVDGDIQAVTVYDLQGRQVLNSNANGSVANNLPAGIYVVRATAGNNCTVTSKIRK